MVGATDEEASGRVRWRLRRLLKGVAKRRTKMKEKKRSKEPGQLSFQARRR